MTTTAGRFIATEGADEVRTAVDSGAAARPQPPGNVPES
jgi:hypothetical protein